MTTVFANNKDKTHIVILIVDSCDVNNGGCDPNAECSHDATNAVKCTCKTGYTNTGSDFNVVCTGNIRYWCHLTTQNIRNQLSKLILDSCQVENGGCGSCGICSHEPTTNAVKCTMKTGYTNTGSGSTIVCTGKAIFICFLTNFCNRKRIFRTLIIDKLFQTVFFFLRA